MNRLAIFDFDHSLIDNNSDTLVVSAAFPHRAVLPIRVAAVKIEAADAFRLKSCGRISLSASTATRRVIDGLN